MRSTIRSEWIKLRSVRGTWVMLGVALAFPVLLAGLISAFGSAADLTAENLFDLATVGGVIASMLLGVFGVTTITSEYAYNTIRPTFAATPRRARVVVAKMFVVSMAAAVAAAALLVLALVVSGIVASSREIDVDFATLDELNVAVVGFVVFAVLVSCFGVALGMLLRSAPGAVAVLILWPLVLEGLIGAVLRAIGVEAVDTWLPYRAATDLWSIRPVTSDLGRAGGGLLFAGFVLILSLVGVVITRRRDA